MGWVVWSTFCNFSFLIVLAFGFWCEWGWAWQGWSLLGDGASGVFSSSSQNEERRSIDSEFHTSFTYKGMDSNTDIVLIPHEVTKPDLISAPTSSRLTFSTILRDLSRQASLILTVHVTV